MDLFRKNVIIALDIQAITKPKLRILWRAYLYTANIQKQGCVNFVTAYWEKKMCRSKSIMIYPLN